MTSAKISTASAPFIGRGRWAIPLYVLEDKNTWKEISDLTKQLENDIDTIKYRRTNTNNPQVLYKTFKETVRKTCRERARKIIPVAKEKIQKLYEKLEWINNCPIQITSDDIALEAIRINEDIDALERRLFETNRDTSKIKNRLEGETISRYWTKLNKEKRPRDTIYRLKNPLEETSGHETNSIQIVEIARNYHEKIQSNDRDPTTNPNQQAIDRILNHIPKTLTSKQRAELANRIMKNETKKALENSANGKAAGMDGIPTEMWKKLSDEYDAEPKDGPHSKGNIIKILTRVFNDIEKHGIQPKSGFNDRWMCPIYKKGDKENIANYRPITVLNTDYKIFTKALFEKLAEIAPDIINSD